MRIVYIANVFPYPPVSGHRIRNYHLLRYLGAKHELNLFLLLPEFPSATELTGLGGFCSSIRCYPQMHTGALDRPGLAIRYLLEGRPPEFRSYYNVEMMHDLQAFFDDHQVDIVQIEDPCMAQYIEAIPTVKHIKKVLTFHDINFRKFDRISRLETQLKRRLRLRLHSAILRRWEPRYAGRFDLCVTMSDIDKDLLKEMNPALHVKTVPNGVDTKSLTFNQKSSWGRELIYVGNMDYRPNIDAVLFFCKEVLPLLVQMDDRFHFTIVGINPRQEVVDLESDHVTVTGMVADVVPWYAKSDICVVPLRAGGGTRLKILEAMALGCPVVSTAVGAEGLDLEDGRHILIADDPSSFVRQIFGLLQNEEVRQRMILSARQQVENVYDWEMIAGSLNSLYQEMTEKTDE
ncbi:MAG: glycosyltransferase [Anaerolineae bacterium]|nr:glycosyltransferase [Anaerolineae bacterium]